MHVLTTYRIFPATSGPGTATSYSGFYIAGVSFEVTASGMWFEGYWWWCCGSGQATSPVECALWSATSGGTGVIIPGSVVTSGTLTAGAWNFVPLATPVQLAAGSPYVAAVAQNGAFPLTNAQFGSGDPFASGIINGPLLAYSSTPDGSSMNGTPYFLNQNPFTTAGSDPAAHFPGTGDGGANLWVDVQVSDTAPAGYTGTFRIWPNKYDASPATQLDNATPFTLATEIRFSGAVASSWLWFYSASSAASLPTWAGVYPAAGTPGVAAPIAQAASPSWLLPAGGAASAGAGWVKCALSTSLPAGSYRVAVYNSAGASGGWSSREFGYFLTGSGGGGISWGPVSSPANGSASSAWIYQANSSSSPPYTDGSSVEPANGTFALDNSLVAGSPQFPYGEVNFNKSAGAPPGAVAESFWVDLEVTPAAAVTWTLAGTATATGTAAGALAWHAAAAGSAASSPAAAGALAQAAALSGTAASIPVTSGALLAATGIAGTASAGTASSGALAWTAALAGAGASASAAAGMLPQQVTAAGTASSSSSASGTLAGTAVLAGTSAAPSAAAGSLTPPLAGTAATVSAAAGGLTWTAAISGSASGATGGTGMLTAVLACAGASATVTGTAGQLTAAARNALAGVAVTVTVTAGQLTVAFLVIVAGGVVREIRAGIIAPEVTAGTVST